MGQVVKGMDVAMSSMNLEKISMVMDKFESQFEDLDVQTAYMEGTVGTATASTTPQEQVDSLMQQVADEAGLELNSQLGQATPATAPVAERNKGEDEALTERLRALREA